jgi:hypothetical protein
MMIDSKKQPKREIDTTNKFAVALNSRGICILNQPIMPMTGDDAILLAAWLVAMTDFGREKFDEVFNAVVST